MLNLEDRQAEIYRPNQPVEVLDAPIGLSGKPVLPGLILQVDWLWKGAAG